MAGYRRRGRCSTKMVHSAAAEGDDRCSSFEGSGPPLPLDTRTMEHILIPTDFSPTSIKAAIFALDLYGTEDVRYTLLNAYLKPAYRNALLPLTVDTERAAKNGLQRVERRCRKHAPQVRLSRIATFHELARAIEELNQDKAVDMVVMGTQGEGNYGRVGHNTTTVVTGDVPAVIAVPSHWEPAPIKHILFADDGQGVSLASMAPLVDIAKRTGASITVMHVGSTNEDPRSKEHLRKLSVAFGDIKHTFITVDSAAVTEAMDKMVVEQEIQLVAVLRRKRSFWDRIFQGSTSKRMALHTTVPLLVLREVA